MESFGDVGTFQGAVIRGKDKEKKIWDVWEICYGFCLAAQLAD